MICGQVESVARRTGTHLGEVGALGHGAGGVDVGDVLEHRVGSVALDGEGSLLGGWS